MYKNKISLNRKSRILLCGFLLYADLRVYVYTCMSMGKACVCCTSPEIPFYLFFLVQAITSKTERFSPQSIRIVATISVLVLSLQHECNSCCHGNAWRKTSGVSMSHVTCRLCVFQNCWDVGEVLDTDNWSAHDSAIWGNKSPRILPHSARRLTEEGKN